MRHMNNTTNAIVIGQTGVHRVVAELLKLGVSPYLPVVDHGIDILLCGGVRLQVKTTQRPLTHWRQAGRLSFTLAHCQTIRQRKYVSCAARKFSEQCDFVVLYAMEANRFWVVPAHVLDGRWTLSIGSQSQWRDLDVNAARLLREQGLSYMQIAERLGSSHHTVMRRLKGGRFSSPTRNYADIEQYENRWDLITGALATLTEATHIVDSAASASVGGREHVLTP